MSSNINTQESWAKRAREASERTIAAREVYEDAKESRDSLLREADRLGWTAPQLAEWFAMSRTRVLDIVTGRKKAA